MKTTTRLVRSTLLGSSVMTLLLGLFLWTGNGARLIPVHELFGYGLLLSVWGAAVIASRAGVSPRTVAFAMAWSVATLLVAVVQRELVPGALHWTIRALHALTGFGAIAWGQRLLAEVRAAAAGRRTRVAPAREATRSSWSLAGKGPRRVS